jgi:hypothetical protein
LVLGWAWQLSNLWDKLKELRKSIKPLLKLLVI